MITIGEILKQIDYIKLIGCKDTTITHIGTFDKDNKDLCILMWVSDKNAYLLKDLKCGTVICSSNVAFEIDKNVNIIFVEKPRDTFRLVLDKFFTPAIEYKIEITAFIDSSVVIPKEVYVGRNVVVEEGCELGERTIIGHNSIIHRGTKIGNAVKIGANCTIGGVGFGYEKDIEGDYMLIPHIGNVVLEDGVEIGNNTCVDRAVLGSTLLSKNVKVDNLVHIAHGVQIGKNSLIIANAMVAGSTIIGENVWVAPSTSLINKIYIEDNSVIGLGAVVVKNVAKNTTVIGNPARPLEKR